MQALQAQYNREIQIVIGYMDLTISDESDNMQLAA